MSPEYYLQPAEDLQPLRRATSTRRSRRRHADAEDRRRARAAASRGGRSGPRRHEGAGRAASGAGTWTASRCTTTPWCSFPPPTSRSASARRIRRDPAEHAGDGRAHHAALARSWTSTIPRRRSRWSSTSGARGTRSCPARTPGFLAQQNSVRDALIAALNINIFARHADRVRMANIAQMVNVLQAMILTDKDEDGPDADLPRVQDVRAVPGRDVRAGDLRRRHATRTAASRCRASTRSPPRTRPARSGSRSRTSIRQRPAEIATTLAGITARTATGETLTGARDRQRQHLRGAEHCRRRNRSRRRSTGDRLTLTLAPKSVTVIGGAAMSRDMRARAIARRWPLGMRAASLGRGARRCRPKCRRRSPARSR